MEDGFSGSFVVLFHLGVVFVIAMVACGICALVNHGNLDGNLPEENITVAATPESTPTPELEPAVAYQVDGDWYTNIVVIDENGEEHLHRVQVIVCEAEDEKGLKYFIPTPNPSVLY